MYYWVFKKVKYNLIKKLELIFKIIKLKKICEHC